MVSFTRWTRSFFWRLGPGLRVRAVRDIGSPLRVAVRAGTSGEVIEPRGVRKVLVRFANGRTLEVLRTAVERAGPVSDSSRR